MLVMGIDPGIAITGYGLIRKEDQGALTCIDYGSVTTPSGLDDGARLKILYEELTQLIQKYHPDSGAVEKLFFQKNVRTAISVGQARGVAMLTLEQAQCPISEYTPNEVKQTVCGYGKAGKSQIQRMVQTLLELQEIPKPDDAADALAVAICHIHHQAFDRFVSQSQIP